MKFISKSTIAKLLVVCLIVSMMGVPVSAATSASGGASSGGSNDSYYVNDDVYVNGDGVYTVTKDTTITSDDLEKMLEDEDDVTLNAGENTVTIESGNINKDFTINATDEKSAVVIGDDGTSGDAKQVTVSATMAVNIGTAKVPVAIKNVRTLTDAVLTVLLGTDSTTGEGIPLFTVKGQAIVAIIVNSDPTAKEKIATFAAPTHDNTISGTVTLDDPGAKYTCLTTDADKGSVKVGLSEDLIKGNYKIKFGADPEKDGYTTYEVEMKGDDYYVLDWSVEPAAGGSVQVFITDKDKDTTTEATTKNIKQIQEGQIVTVNATYNEGYSPSGIKYYQLDKDAKIIPDTGADYPNDGIKVGKNGIKIEVTFEKMPEGAYHVKYNPTPANGKVSVEVDGKAILSGGAAKEEVPIVVKADPDDGYKVGAIKYYEIGKDGSKVDPDGKPITSSRGIYSFKMPPSDIEIAVTFEKTNDGSGSGSGSGSGGGGGGAGAGNNNTGNPTTPDNGPTSAFTDVSTDAYYFDAVNWAVALGIIQGRGDGTFDPDATCIRADMMVMLWRLAGSPKAEGENPFTDVSADDYFYDAILWAVSKGITKGTTETTFDPYNTVNRAQSVTFLYRYAGEPAASGSSFKDVSADAYYANAAAWASQNGIALGYGDGNFGPDDACVRAQIVTFMYRYAGK